MWRTDSYKPKITVGLYQEERELIWDTMFDVYQQKRREYEITQDVVTKNHLKRELDMIIGLRHKMQI